MAPNSPVSGIARLGVGILFKDLVRDVGLCCAQVSRDADNDLIRYRVGEAYLFQSMGDGKATAALFTRSQSTVKQRRSFFHTYRRR